MGRYFVNAVIRRALLTNAVLATGICTAVATSSGGVATHSGSSTRCGGATLSGVSDQIAHLRAAGASWSRIDEVLASRFCLADVTARPSIALVSTSPGEQSLTAPHVYADSSTNEYYSVGFWDWSNSSLPDLYHDAQSPGGNTTVNVGGPDGVATNYNTVLVQDTTGNKATEAEYWGTGAYFGFNSSTTYASNGRYGTGFRIQDKLREVLKNGQWVTDYNMMHGEIVTEFFGTKSGKCETGVAGWMNYGHTWRSGSVGTSFSISAGSAGVNFEFNTTTVTWPHASAQSSPSTVCYHGP
jgi:hypothetical protein